MWVINNIQTTFLVKVTLPETTIMVCACVNISFGVIFTMRIFEGLCAFGVLGVSLASVCVYLCVYTFTCGCTCINSKL